MLVMVVFCEVLISALGDVGPDFVVWILYTFLSKVQKVHAHFVSIALSVRVLEGIQKGTSAILEMPFYELTIGR